MKRTASVLTLALLGVFVFGTDAAHGQSTASIVGWGENDRSQCNAPAPNEDFTDLAAGRYHGLGVKSDGTVAAWYHNLEGQCLVPSPNADFVAVAAGYEHSLGLKSDGRIVAWGYNDFGQCDVAAPNAGFEAVAGGLHHSLGLKSDGTIVAWGFNTTGQCDVPAPNSGFIAVAAGGYHSLGLKSDGTIVAWGRDDYGQCVVPAPNGDFNAIAGGTFFSLGLTRGDSPVEGVFYATVAPEDDGVLLRWMLPSCPGVGLKIYRSLSADGPYSCMTPDPLPDPEQGSFADETVWPGGVFWYELRAILGSGEEVLATDTRPSVVMPGTLVFGIRHVTPNPATAYASIGYALPGGWRSARLSVHDLTGRVVRRLDPATGTHGYVTTEWDGRTGSGESVASGVYFLRLEVDGAVAAGRVVLLR